MRATAIAHPNIALIKYWGKRDAEANLPASGSLSLTLGELGTRMSVDLSAGADRLAVNGEPRPDLAPRVFGCLDDLLGVDRPPAVVDSQSNFPIGAGLASSASSFAALVVATSAAAGLSADTLAMARAAGRASGSAARSLYDGIVLLENAGDTIVVQTLRGPTEWPLAVVIAVTSDAGKPLGSGPAMQRSAATSPFYQRWIEQQDGDLVVARKAVDERDFAALGEVAEQNCLKMHSVMWTSRPPIVYWNAATLETMETVRRLRAEGVPVYFTIDAGPQVKAVCPAEVVDVVERALAKTAGVLRTMVAPLGCGARVEQAS